VRAAWSDIEVVLGVTGSIAAYKACEIASRLVKAGVRVTPVLTESAQQLVGPASFEAITGQRAITRMFEPLQNPEVEHIAVARRASLFLIAPATANILGKAGRGLADDWLSTTLLATRAPILFAPAMNTDMYGHPAVQENLRILAGRGCRFVGPVAGRLACGTSGLGKMIEPEAIVEAALPLALGCADLAGKRVLITSGGTREPLDPVRYLGNRSSGKMGRALAWEALLRGAEVHVITGPGAVAPPHGAEVAHVETAAEMDEALQAAAPNADIVIAAAAVSDYRAANPLQAKHKRESGLPALELEENPDLIGELSRQRRQGQILVGFAAETNDLLGEGAKKLRKKGLDLLVANRVGTAESGFEADTVEAAILDRGGVAAELGVVTKAAAAEQLFERLAALVSS
jgi:phosphopantothenoylcysteine decarboxylase/phosphopantothenate--cysteine ligase